MEIGASEERIVSNTVEDPMRVNSLLTDDTHREEGVICEIEDDTSEDQTHYEEESTTGATLSMDNWLRPSIEDPPDLELKTLPEHLEYAFLEEGLKLPVIIVGNVTVGQKEKLLAV